MTKTEFRDALEAYCRVTAASETSGGRTPAHNKRVGGVQYSAHQVWLAADVVYDAPLTPAMRQEWAKRLGLKLVIESDHDHLQPLDRVAG